jgi:hypothetical protein
MNAINVISPYRHNGMRVFDDPRVELVQEPFVAGPDNMIDRVVVDIPDAERETPSISILLQLENMTLAIYLPACDGWHNHRIRTRLSRGILDISFERSAPSKGWFFENKHSGQRLVWTIREIQRES